MNESALSVMKVNGSNLTLFTTKTNATVSRLMTRKEWAESIGESSPNSAGARIAYAKYKAEASKSMDVDLSSLTSEGYHVTRKSLSAKGKISLTLEKVETKADIAIRAMVDATGLSEQACRELLAAKTAKTVEVKTA